MTTLAVLKTIFFQKLANYGAFILKTKAKKSHITNNSKKKSHIDNNINVTLFNSLKSSFLGTTLAQRLPADMEDKVVEFHRFVLRARQRCRYESSQILNMDETLTRFELPATRTLEFTGNQTVPILSCGGNKQSFTVVLAMKADGEKLPPKVIFESRC